MDQLDILKESWQKVSRDYPTKTASEITSIIHKRSSSMVKWIFYISIAEFILWISLNLFLGDPGAEELKKLGVYDFIQYSNIAYYIGFTVFIYLFWRNYRDIKVTDTTRSHMNSIMHTRRTVRWFVYFNISVFVLSLFVAVVAVMLHPESADPEIQQILQSKGSTGYWVLGLIYFVFTAVCVGILLLFYYLVYGILLGKLKKNHNELSKIEI